jgi:tetratricopeptide (TPR) repeat protein
MVKFLSHKTNPDPALTRYPAAMAGLLSLGKVSEDMDYRPIAEPLAEYAPDLIRMVLDDDLNMRDEHDRAVWAPYHALNVLGELGPAEAAEPLTACLDTEDDWVGEKLPAVYAAIGPAALPVLHAYLADREHDTNARGAASNALVAIAQTHPAARDEIIACLTAFLDRPDAGVNGDEEVVTAFVIADLGDLKALSAYEAIRRAYAEDRVDGQIIGLEDVERDFEMGPPLDFSAPPKPRDEPGVRLVLKCKVCGREREHIFPKVYYDLGTANDDKKKDKYDPLIIPQHVICPKCGAVDQYELGTMGHMAVTASLLALRFPDGGGFLRENQRVTFLNFTTRWGPMHPQEAIERYQRELARQPEDVSLYVGFGNLYKILGRHGQAESAYTQALRLDPDAAEAWLGMAQLAGMRRDIPEAMRCWEKVQETCRRSDLSPADQILMGESAEEALADLHQGIIPPSEPPLPTAPAAPKPSKGASSDTSQRKVGRNEPCPCGSGKKYKHCHGRKG